MSILFLHVSQIVIPCITIGRSAYVVEAAFSTSHSTRPVAVTKPSTPANICAAAVKSTTDLIPLHVVGVKRTTRIGTSVVTEMLSISLGTTAAVASFLTTLVTKFAATVRLSRSESPWMENVHPFGNDKKLLTYERIRNVQCLV